MNITDLRKKSRRSDERRSKERRVNTFEFGSPQWVEHTKKVYAFWPKADRRNKVRRANERRVGKRRQLNLEGQQLPGKRSAMSLLSREEKELFMDIFNEDVH